MGKVRMLRFLRPNRYILIMHTSTPSYQNNKVAPSIPLLFLLSLYFFLLGQVLHQVNVEDGTAL